MRAADLRATTGSLVVVGTGIRLGQLTLEAKCAIEGSDFVFSLVASPAAASLLDSLHPDVRCLRRCYQEGRDRADIYEEITGIVTEAVRSGHNVAFALYGHPGVFSFPPHEAVRRLKGEGFKASMLPGISAEDCIFADLNLDPADTGCQSFEATDFVLYDRVWDSNSLLILWQVGFFGERRFLKNYGHPALAILLDRLKGAYGSDHQVVLYEAPMYPECDPTVLEIPLSELIDTSFSNISTMVVPPKGESPANPKAAALLCSSHS